VSGATALPNTNLNAKIDEVNCCFDEGYDFVFLHIKATDSLGEDGDAYGKREFIEKIDASFSRLKLSDDILLSVTGDHSTPCSLKTHSADPVPIFLWGPGLLVDDVSSFGERASARGGLGVIQGCDLVPEILNVLNMSKFVGA
jgi:2,3-bisphosphoglycerate-independent phosphoglycerate mutase